MDEGKTKHRLDGCVVTCTIETVRTWREYRHFDCVPPDRIPNAATGWPQSPWKERPVVEADTPPNCDKCGKPLRFIDD